MENYIGKICPFCKTEIKDGDTVKVCPACNIPHHEGCWDENKGCTTFGCSEQHYEPQGTNPTDVCAKCGAVLGDGQEFCAKCGTPKNQSKANVCGKCGAELQDGQEFCPKCGQKAGLLLDTSVASKINQFNEVRKKSLKKPLVIAVSVLVAVITLFGVFNLIPNTEELLAEGNYEKAYASASADEKEIVLFENILAVISSDAADALKDSSSFVLKEAYISEDYSEVVAQISGKNSYGGTVSSYWYYTFDKEKSKYSLFTTYSSLEKEKENSWDDTDEKLEKLLKNIYLDSVIDVITDGTELPKPHIKNINELFENDILDSIELLYEVEDHIIANSKEDDK